ncbi:ADP-ribosylglycohydrolase [Agrocybe pediades]|nr:ADP-ribosylglycohydrolase [Agrocybe pediades]
MTSHPASQRRPSLSSQLPNPASVACKIRLSMLATALIDALGGPAEFHARFSFPFVSDMIPNDYFNLPAGVWTDDTSMMLCLAESISCKPQAKNRLNTLVRDEEEKGGFDEIHQLSLYTRWKNTGYLSAVDNCFDVGVTISTALDIYEENASQRPEEILSCIKRALSDEQFCGNGSLMRILPIGLAYWRDRDQARALARRSSATTHPSLMCLELCEMWTGAISLIMENTTARGHKEGKFSKLNLLAFISSFPYTHNKLRDSLTIPSNAPKKPSHGEQELEEWYFTHHPLLKLINETQGPSARRAGSRVIDNRLPYYIPSEAKLPSSGYILHSAIAALYCFFATTSFEHGALMAVNLGRDADTVGAIYAGLAGCWHGAMHEPGQANTFWSEGVMRWKARLVRLGVVEEVAEQLVNYERRLSEMSV